MKASHDSAPESEFDLWWNRQGEWVEAENQRRGGQSGVQLLPAQNPPGPELYSKRQHGHLYRSLRHPWGRPTVLRELDAYAAIGRLGILLPRVVFGGARKRNGQWQALLVTEALDGFVSLDRWYAAAPEAALNEAIIAELALTLARLHRAHWQHGCCYPKHIFVRAAQGEAGSAVAEVALIDLEKCRRRLRAQTASRRDLDQLGRHWDRIPRADFERLQQHYANAFGRV